MVAALPGSFAAAALLVVSSAAAQAMSLTSADFSNGGKLPLAQVNSRCGGGNRSPALAWTGAPAGTKGFALTLFDPDAGGGRGFWHWLVFDLPANSGSLPEGAGSGAGLPQGAVQATNSFGETGYGGACPPAGAGPHHYKFTLYALGAIASPPAGDANAGALAAFFQGHALATATLTAVFQR